MEGNIIQECAHIDHRQKYTCSQFLLQVVQLWWEDRTQQKMIEWEDMEWEKKTEVQEDILNKQKALINFGSI